MPKFNVEQASKAQLQYVMLEMAKKEGWRYSERDVEAYLKCNPNGIYTLTEEAELDSSQEKKKIVGCIMLTSYTTVEPQETIASIGLFIVDEQYRGKKECGPVLWDYIARLTGKMKLSLNSVPRVEGFYKKKGFFNPSVVSSNQYQLLISHEDAKEDNIGATVPAHLIQLKSGQGEGGHSTLKLTKYDAELFGRVLPERTNFLNVWTARPDAVVLAYLNGDQKLEGYGVLTECGTESGTRYMNLSPMYANQVDVANQLLKLFLLYIKRDKNAVNSTVIQLNAIGGNSYTKGVLTGNGFEKAGPDHDTSLMLNYEKGVVDLATLMKVVALSPLEYPHEYTLMK